ncbi:hypothetical protein TVAG_316130 [Trichomonas vaginalis G3]|uniref:receptor protein-tyrosine kinase n=1 Tax=Trichomonas vaginalis (strain ATCC PRA-98 / G3) TaxID=412133 RepID=A2FAX1_TRIV3|nr:glycine-rich protein family [Trichomonas vaginalis G3]EAX97948.1 hypothetical protein TVAG_316130 [Trichomonas vaginalis G3]KAI5502544.1 glycine-rich protein family [Trichomonas vaginalis G3]|eukprot:XP_001310878.1 hypothetical protein [Trichomonas vaginalis G3]
MQPNSGGNGSYVSGEILLTNPSTFCLYLGAKGEDQTKFNDYTHQTLGGWNFGGNGGIDKSDINEPDFSYPPESGAGGGGAVDLRLEYVDINSPPLDNISLEISLKSRIIVAGSGGGAVSNDNKFGMPGGSISAVNNGMYIFGGTQTKGELGKGMDAVDTDGNQGGSGGCGSGYRGCYNTLSNSIRGNNIFEFGGSGGSSYISGHPGCISPQYPSTTIANETTPFHESKLYFTKTNMKAGNEYMPDPLSDGYILGHIGHGVCRITFLFSPFCQTNAYCLLHDFSFLLHLVFVCLDSE